MKNHPKILAVCLSAALLTMSIPPGFAAENAGPSIRRRSPIRRIQQSRKRRPIHLSQQIHLTRKNRSSQPVLRIRTMRKRRSRRASQRRSLLLTTPSASRRHHRCQRHSPRQQKTSAAGRLRAILHWRRWSEHQSARRSGRSRQSISGCLQRAGQQHVHPFRLPQL